ncbi:MAG TPA: hypothetical protein VF407_07990, partial [Polyangiaceae bacterium]
DIDGDGKLDLVLTRRYSDTSVGKKSWKVFKGDGDGFASTATDFALPALSGTSPDVTPFGSLSDGLYIDDAQTDYVSYATLDVDGDHKLDVVVTRRYSDTSVGRSAWSLYNGQCAAE